MPQKQSIHRKVSGSPWKTYNQEQNWKQSNNNNKKTSKWTPFTPKNPIQNQTSNKKFQVHVLNTNFPETYHLKE